MSKAWEEPMEYFGTTKRQKVEEAITFTEEDAVSMQHPHSDVVVVTLNIDNYDVHRILVDSENAVDIQYFSAFS